MGQGDINKLIELWYDKPSLFEIIGSFYSIPGWVRRIVWYLQKKEEKKLFVVGYPRGKNFGFKCW
jgi:hypothetical protein